MADQEAFNHRVIDDIAHRPWPMPRTPWIMTQSWQDLLFAHWRLDPAQLAPSIPAPLQLDLFRGEAWIAVVPFHMAHVSPRGVPALPWVSAFPEVNVRTYVRLGDKPGVFFFSLDATNPLAVRVARSAFHLPYYQASIAVQLTAAGDGVQRYASHRTDPRTPIAAADLVASYRATGPVFHAEEGTLEYFLTERYCLYALDTHRRVHICEIHHAPWPLQVAEATFQTNSLLGSLLHSWLDEEAVGDVLAPPLLHFSKRQDTITWRPTRMTDSR
jgi:uncharacterized protein YqjF (DUF2071 family)